MAEHNQQRQGDEQNREWVPSARSIYYDARIANALIPPNYPINDLDTPTWEDGLREIEAFNWLGSDEEEEVHSKGEASPPETNPTSNPGAIVEKCSEYVEDSFPQYEEALGDSTPELDHLSDATATTPLQSHTSPPGTYEPTSPVHRLQPYSGTQSYSSTPVCPMTPPYQSPYADSVVQTPPTVQPPRTLEYFQTFQCSPALETIREKKVPGDEVLVEMLYNTVVFDPSSSSSDTTQEDPNQSQEHFNNMKIREQGNLPPTTPPRPIPPTVPLAPKKIHKHKSGLGSKAAIAGAGAAHRDTARRRRPIALVPKTMPKDKANVGTKAIEAGIDKVTEEYRSKRVKTGNHHGRPKATAYGPRHPEPSSTP